MDYVQNHIAFNVSNTVLQEDGYKNKHRSCVYGVAMARTVLLSQNSLTKYARFCLFAYIEANCESLKVLGKYYSHPFLCNKQKPLVFIVCFKLSLCGIRNVKNYSRTRLDLLDSKNK